MAQVRAQPWRCLCRRFSQITMTRPCRRITLHLSQIFLTLGLTFIFVPSVVPRSGRDRRAAPVVPGARRVSGWTRDDYL
ncbi:Uncharacterised protein [Mycobacteroides abscessus]|nr:Uncharacterised protein [Mycobacteroides abscessus]